MSASTLTLVFVLACATARLTWLVTDDSISRPLRAWIITRFGAASMVAELVHCTWCTGMWCAGGLVALAYWAGLAGGWASAIILVPAVAWVAQMLGAAMKG